MARGKAKAKVKVLVIGGGGREHALVRALVDDRDVEHVLVAPGNGGTAAMEDVTNVPLEDPRDLVAFATREFAKRFMQKYAIPTAPFRVFEHIPSALRFLKERFEEAPERAFFVKADELCAGKGAFPARSLEEAERALRKLLDEKACGVGERVVVEEALRGEEASLLALTDGRSVATLPPAQDYKRAYDGDEGPNTGGMGAYAPTPVVTEAVYRRVEQEIVLPTLLGMEEERLSDRGVLYFGLMIDPKGGVRRGAAGAGRAALARGRGRLRRALRRGLPRALHPPERAHRGHRGGGSISIWPS